MTLWIYIDVLLGHATVVYLIDNPFIKILSDLGVDKIKEMKVCWIERCNKMESVMMGTEKVSDTAKSGGQAEEMEIFGDNLETLLISNATNLECIARGNLKNLKCLYHDCCPKVSEVFCLTQQFENLEVLEIKGTGFENLENLELPVMKSIGVKLLPLKDCSVRECPKLQKIPAVVRTRSSNTLKQISILL